MTFYKAGVGSGTLLPALELASNLSPATGEDGTSNNIRLESVRFLENPYYSCLGNDSVEEGGTSSNNVIMENGIRP